MFANAREHKVVVTFVKRTNLMEFCHGVQEIDRMAPMEYYSKERDVRLVVTERITTDGRIFCRINCPINPLPVKGEFEIPNWSAFKRFLVSQGWKQHEVLTDRFFE